MSSGYYIAAIPLRAMSYRIAYYSCGLLIFGGGGGGGGGGKRVVTSEGVMKFCIHNLCCLGKTLTIALALDPQGPFASCVVCIDS